MGELYSHPLFTVILVNSWLFLLKTPTVSPPNLSGMSRTVNNCLFRHSDTFCHFLTVLSRKDNLKAQCSTFSEGTEVSKLIKTSRNDSFINNVGPL